MSKINDTTDYGTVAPASGDLLIGTDTSNTTNDANGETATFTAQSIADLKVVAVQKQATLSISAAASGTWAIPAGCVRIEFVAENIVPSAAAIFEAKLNKQSDGLNASFSTTHGWKTEGTANFTVNQLSSATSIINMSVSSATSAFITADGAITYPRDAAKKTVARCFALASSSGSTDNQFRHQVGRAVTAEDHDELVFEVDTGTMTGDVEIVYWVEE